MKLYNTLPALAAAAGMILTTGTASAATLLSTGFDGTTLGGTTDMTGITYTTSAGLTGPTSLNGSYSIFTGSESAGHFTPNVNVGNGNPWTVVFSMVVGASDLQIDEVVWDRQQFGSNQLKNDANTGKMYTMDVNLTGSLSGNYGTVTSTAAVNTSVVDKTSEFAFNNVAQAGETLTMTLTVNGATAGGGVYIGMDGFTVNGSAIPEPSAALLGALGLLTLLRRRRTA